MDIHNECCQAAVVKLYIFPGFDYAFPSNRRLISLIGAHYTLYSVQCTLYSVHCTLCTVNTGESYENGKKLWVHYGQQTIEYSKY